MTYTVKHTIETSIEEFWRLYFDQALSRAMLKEVGNVADFAVVEEATDERGVVHRRVECTTHVELPELVRKLVGDGAYTEWGAFDRTLPKYSARCVPKVGAERILTRFEVMAAPLGNGACCERIIAVDNIVKVRGIGGLLERALERFQREGHRRTADFINAWLHRSRGWEVG